MEYFRGSFARIDRAPYVDTVAFFPRAAFFAFFFLSAIVKCVYPSHGR